MNRAAFYLAIRVPALFGAHISPSQVAGIEAILNACPSGTPSDHLAYALATTFHETARTMLPIKEKGGPSYFTNRYDIRGGHPDIARRLGNVQPGDGALFYGRGYVQLTGRQNYERAGAKLRNAGIAVDLLAHPDDALKPEIAAPVMFLGMEQGWFTGRKLADYFGPGRCDPVNARRIINSLDCCNEIAGFFRSFQAALPRSH